MYYAAQDIVEYLMNSVGGGSQDSEHRLLRSAAHHAYRDLMHCREWHWLSSEAPLPAAVSGTNGKEYVLPANVKTVDGLITPDRTTAVSYITPREWRILESESLAPGSAVYWTVVPDPTKPDRWRLKIAGNPTPIESGKTYYITFRRKPLPLKYMGFEEICRNGTLDATSAPGAVKRYGTATHHPEGPSGIYPYTAEEVLGVAGSLIGTPPAGARTVVSDRLDVSESMFTALLSGAEVWLAKMLGKNVEGALAVYNRDLRMAFEADSPAPIAGRREGIGRYPEVDAVSWGTPRAMGYYSPSQPDTGV